MKLTEVPIIGLSGKIGSGKTTFSNYLRNLQYDLEPRSFAEILRQMTAIFINRPVDKLRSIEDKNSDTCMDQTVGVILQKLGTEVGRAIHKDAWVRSLFLHYEEGLSRWIIDDVRFPNEADEIKRRGGVVIRFEGDPGDVRKNTTRDLTHPSETALDDYENFDVIIKTEDFMNDLAGILAKVEETLLSK